MGAPREQADSNRAIQPFHSTGVGIGIGYEAPLNGPLVSTTFRYALGPLVTAIHVDLVLADNPDYAKHERGCYGVEDRKFYNDSFCRPFLNRSGRVEMLLRVPRTRLLAGTGYRVGTNGKHLWDAEPYATIWHEISAGSTVPTLFVKASAGSAFRQIALGAFFPT